MLLNFATIEPINYQAALVEVPIARAKMLRSVAGSIANADGIMKVRPYLFYEANGAREEALYLTLSLRRVAPPS